MKMREKIFFASALFVGLAGSFLSMLEWDLNIITSLFTAPLSITGLRNGFLLIFNRLFTISEQHQQFRYVMFRISSPEIDWNGNIAVGFAVIAALFAGISFALAATRRKWPVVAVMLLTVGVQVYFGVFAYAVWNIVLFATIAVMLANRRNTDGGITFRGIITVATLLLLISVAVWLVYPGRNMQLHEFSEAIRDRFDTRVNPFSVEPFGTHDVATQPELDNLDLNIAGVQDDNLHESPTVGYHVDYDESPQGAEVGFTGPVPSLLPAIIVVILLMILAAVYRFVPPLYKAAKRRRMFTLDDYPVAINNMFLYMLEWLAVIGLERKNVVFSAYAPQLAVLISPQYSDEYERMTVLWQEAVYSNNEPGETKRKQMVDFLEQTKGFVWKKSSISTKLRIKLHYFL